MWVVWALQVINESNPQRLATIVLIVPGPLRKLKMTKSCVKETFFFNSKGLSMACHTSSDRTKHGHTTVQVGANLFVAVSYSGSSKCTVLGRTEKACRRLGGAIMLCLALVWGTGRPVGGGVPSSMSVAVAPMVLHDW